MKKPNKKITSITIIFVCVIVAVVGYYSYLSGRSRESRHEADLSEVQLVLSRDLNNDYPPTPKEVLRYYNEILECLYNEECTDEEIEQLGNKAREMYDEELLENNEQEEYLARLRADVESYRENNMRIANSSVASGANVDYFEEDGYEFARIHCGYTITENGVSGAVREVYLLRRDENRLWKIYGWDLAQNVNPGGVEESDS
nr:DUF6715 family protein [uncultured Acetatifactor sp.]